VDTRFAGSPVAATTQHAANVSSGSADPLSADARVEGCESDEMLARVGQITRTLHESLRELGFDKVLERATADIPDVRERLNYVARMTEQAAQRVLNATDAAIPMQERIDEGADEILSGWRATFSAPFSEAAYRDMATMTMQCLADMRNDTSATKQQLLDIMMAQDFQDLTGQVIRKVTDLAHNLEQQLVQLLIDYAPAEIRRDSGSGLLNGPQINPEKKSDVVSDQSQVDDLLDSLGF
jgi:chemotaxis protein CheZ